MKKFYLLVTLFFTYSLSSPLLAFATDLPTVNFSTTFKAGWPHIDRPNTSDYEPVAMDDGQWKVWHCGNEVINGEGGDTIFYTSFKADGSYDQPTTPVLRHTNNDNSEDGSAACSPTVIKYANPLINQGKETYRIYYECARRFYPKCQAGDSSCNPNQVVSGGFAQICSAISDDGLNWHKYGDGSTEAAPVIKAAPAIIASCQVEFTGGRFRAVFPACNNVNNYGVGHPSAIVMTIGGKQEIWLYYYDAKGVWQDRGVYLVKSTDGITFSSPQKTNVTNPLKVKYLKQQIGNYNGVFIGTLGIFSDNYYAYSFDGLNWIWPEPDPLTNYSSPIASRKFLKIGEAVPDYCAAPGYAGIIGDSHGVLSSSTVSLFSGEGFLGTSDGCTLTNGCTCYSANEDHIPEPGNLEGRGSTWAIHLIQGIFNITPPSPLPGDLNADGHVNLADYNLLVSNFGNPYTIFDYNNLVANFEKQ